MHLDCSNCSDVEGISGFLGRFSQLNYLNLSYCKNIGELPEALGGLSKLQYLDLSFSSYLGNCTEVDFLGTLTKLEYLNLSSEQCGLRKLPEALCQFIQLKYLNVAGCSDLAELPRLFGSLKSLVHLDLSHCHRVVNLHEALSGLNNLRYLNLQCTTCSVLPDDLSKLMYLNVSDLRLSYKYNEEGCHIDHISNTLTSLQHLDLSRNCNIISIPESICNLRNLHTLDLSECRRIKKIPESLGKIDSLKYLNLNGCWSLSNLPQLSSSAVCLPHFVVQPGYSDFGSNLVQLQYTDPVQLEISKLENVKSVAEGHCIKLMEKKSLVRLSLKWTRAVKRFVDDKILLEKLVPPRTLKKLEICGYNGVSFPSWVVGQLLNLDSLVLRDMANLEEWSTSYSSGEEHVIDTLEIHDCPMFRMKPLALKAKSWIISKSDNVLSSWEEEGTLSHISWKLHVAYYKVPMHQWRFLQQFPGLTYLVLNNCSDLTSSPEITRHLSYVKTLRLENMEELPVWMGELTSLKKLLITGWGGRNELNLRQLTKLKSLEFSRCNSIASLPNWLGELTSLKELIIGECTVLRSLPQSIKQLTSLQNLEIRFCHELKYLVEPEERTVKLTDNHEQECVLPTSLESLVISYCLGIKSLPGGIQQLTNLETLRVAVCPELLQWCEVEENKTKLAHIDDLEFLYK